MGKSVENLVGDSYIYDKLFMKESEIHFIFYISLIFYRLIKWASLFKIHFF